MAKKYYYTMIHCLMHPDGYEKVCICDFSRTPATHTLCGAPIEGGLNKFNHLLRDVGKKPNTATIDYVTCPDCLAVVDFVKRVIDNQPPNPIHVS